MAPIAGDVHPRALELRCGVCGSTDVGVDEVLDRGLWRLGECRRCRHRWTEGPFGREPVRAASPVRSEPAAA